MVHSSKSIKLVALKLSTLMWFDRYLLLKQFDSSIRNEIKQALRELEQLKISNKRALLAQLLNRDEVLEEDAQLTDSSVSLLNVELQRLLLNKNSELSDAMHKLLKFEVTKAIQGSDK